MRLLKNIFPKKSVEKNQVANKISVTVAKDDMRKQNFVSLRDFEINLPEFLQWQKDFFPEGEAVFQTPMHKKLLELFVSYKLLQVEEGDTYLDAAGGQYSYASRIKCKTKIIQDIRLSDKLKAFHGNKVQYLDSSCADIPLESRSINKISCHHSIEHFQQSADTQFIIEVQRLLAPGGRCVVLPIFIASKAILLTDKPDFHKWDEKGEWVFDETATLPGGKGSGHFSRVYSPESLKSRLLDHIDMGKFKIEICQVKMDGEEIPNKNLFMKADHAVMNYFYRALVVEKF